MDRLGPGLARGGPGSRGQRNHRDFPVKFPRGNSRANPILVLDPPVYSVDRAHADRVAALCVMA